MIVLLLLEMCFVAVFASVVFEDCGSAYDLQAVSIEGCGMRLPCYVTLGKDIPVRLQFRAGFESRKLDQNVVITINHVNLRTDVTPELCDSVVCPVRTDATTLFTSIMTVPVDIALNQRGVLRWRIYNESGVQVLCYSVLVQTQSVLQQLIRNGNGFYSPDSPSYTPSVYLNPYHLTYNL